MRARASEEKNGQQKCVASVLGEMTSIRMHTHDASIFTFLLHFFIVVHVTCYYFLGSKIIFVFSPLSTWSALCWYLLFKHTVDAKQSSEIGISAVV